MPRQQIYVSQELKLRMDDVKDDLNWSAIAQTAFEAAIVKRQTAIYERRIGLELALCGQPTGEWRNEAKTAPRES